ncbi:MAG: LptE family protein [Candidatus Omnitrophota bacterium]
MIRFFIGMLISCFLFLPVGCGYTTASLLPAELDSIYVEDFKNDINPAGEISDKRATYTYRTGMENDITRAIIDKFIYDKTLDIENKSNAALFMKGALKDFRQSTVSYNTDSQAEEYRMEIFVDVEVYNQLTGELMWEEKGFLGEITYAITGPNSITESTAVTNTIADLAQRILERTVEVW